MKIPYFISLIFLMSCRQAEPVFNQQQFSQNLDSARWLGDYQHYTQLALYMYHRETGKKAFLHYSYYSSQGVWITTIGHADDGRFVADFQTHQVSGDSLISVPVFLNHETAEAYIAAFAIAVTDFRYQKYSILIRRHPDLSFTVWAFPVYTMANDFLLPVFRFDIQASGDHLDRTTTFYLDMHTDENGLVITNPDADQPGIPELFVALQSSRAKVVIQNRLFKTTYIRSTKKWKHRYSPYTQNKTN